jgi:DNA-binding SARP family transcriptional activator
MEIRLLGPLEVRDGDGVVALPRRQQRALLAALALRAGHVVSTDRLIADLWGERAPASATGSLQNTVHALRKLLGRDALVTQAPGYRLAVDPAAVDVNRFEALVAEARDAEPAAAARVLAEAERLWRGPAFADLDEHEFTRLEAARLEELRVTALEERIAAELELGRHAALVGELEQLVATHPLRERLRGQLMLALYRCGRQAEALEVYRAARLALADELGLDPSPELQELERRILRQDPSLAPAAEVLDPPTRAAPELRLVTVLAVTPPSHDDPERHRRLLDETLAAVQEALERHGGTLERFGPEGIVIVFGAERPSDDDAERAVLLARELGLPAGVATGETVAGAGAVFTRAAELARAGGIRLDGRTQALVQAERTLEAPLVGRREELGRLRAELQGARQSGRCRVVTVVGEPGIGKTRVARELALTEGGGATVLVARCVAHGGGATFLPLLGALRRADPEQAVAGADDAELVLARLAALAEGEAPLGESYWAIRRLLEALGRHQPVLLLLDDVHWAEPALADLVDYLAERAEAPMLVLCLARPELERPLGDVLRLGPVQPDEARAIATRTAELDDALRERVVAAAEGNPLYLEQLAQFAAEGSDGLPPTLEAVLAARLGRLTPEERSVLQRAAVIGREFSLGAVGALSDGEVARELLALSRAGFLHPAPAADPADDGYAFHHVLLRDAAYAGLTKADRAELHERAARWLDTDDAFAGYHLEQAVRYHRELGDDADELAALAGERLGTAGMRAWRTGNDVATVDLLNRALALLPPGENRVELQLEQTLALGLRERRQEADELRARAERDAHALGSKRLQARAACEWAEARLITGATTLDETVRVVEQARPALEAAGDARGLARAELILCNVHWFAWQHEELAAAAARAERYAVEAGYSGSAAIGVQAEVLFYGPMPVGAATDRCADLLRRAGTGPAQATATAVLGILSALEGRTGDARLLLEAARSLFEETGNERGVLTVWTPLFVILESIAGNVTAALEAGRPAVEQLFAEGALAHAPFHAALLADILLEAGENDAAEPYVRLAEQHALPSDVYIQFLSRSARARLLARSGEIATAEKLASDAVALASLTDALLDRARAHFALAEVHQHAGRSSEARAQASEARRLLRQKGAVALLDRHPAETIAQT